MTHGAGGHLKCIPTEFAAAGRDAVSLVMFCVFWENESKTQSDGPGRQITAFPRPKGDIYVADAEANKVRLLYLRVRPELTWTLPTPFCRRSQPLVLNFPRM